MIRAALLVLFLCGCGTKLGARLGDQTYYHKPHCADPYVEVEPEEVYGFSVPDFKKRMLHVERSPQHVHYYC